MSSGKRESVMLLCISLVDKLYLAPIEYYEPDAVHIYISDRNDVISSVERRIYETVKDGILCKNVVEHHINTSDYEDVLGDIIEVKKDLHERFGDDVDIFINISSGTPEFSAAGMFASMLPQHAIAFRVDTECSMISDELSESIKKIRDSIMISEPERVTGLRDDRPEDEMIAFLTVVQDLLKKTKHPKYRDIINGLKSADEWSYDPDKKSGYGRTTLEEKEERYLKRHYIAIALENGWLERPTPSTMRLTESGKAYVSVYSKAPSAVCNDDSLRYMESDYMMYDADPLRSCCLEPEEFWHPPESNVVTFGRKGERYTFTIEMDQHR